MDSYSLRMCLNEKFVDNTPYPFVRYDSLATPAFGGVEEDRLTSSRPWKRARLSPPSSPVSSDSEVDTPAVFTPQQDDEDEISASASILLELSSASAAAAASSSPSSPSSPRSPLGPSASSSSDGELSRSSSLSPCSSSSRQQRAARAAELYAQNKKKRQRTTTEQLHVLEKVFETDKMPNQQTRAHLAEQLGMSPRRVQIWFQNKRAKVKRMSQRESDELNRSAKEVFSDEDRSSSPLPPSVASPSQQTAQTQNLASTNPFVFRTSSLTYADPSEIAAFRPIATLPVVNCRPVSA